MDITFRQYVDDDLDRCAELAAEAWPFMAVITEDIHSLMEGFVKFCLLWSDYTEVCCTNNQVVGFLFGLTQKRLPGFRQSLEMNKISWQFITGKYGKPKPRLRFLATCVQTLMKVEFYGRTFESDVEFFVVDKEYRGRGIGQTLMDHFAKHLRQAGKKTVYVYTDVECNWTFYEKYGFVKHKDFYDNALSFLRAEKTYSYIYSYTL